MTKPVPFIRRYGLWTDTQERAADELRRRLAAGDIKLIRMAWADPHGASRAKTVTLPVFLSALEAGYNINVATSTLDSSNARTFSSFTRGGGMGLDEMTGSPNITIVPDPATYRELPWAPGVGWVLCDEYFNDATPYHFSPRHLLRRQLARLAEKKMGCVVGLEVEWYLLRIAEDHLTDDHIGAPGLRARPVHAWPVEPGYSYHSESNMDLMQPVLSALAETYEAIGLPLRSMENEWGPGQVECTFAAGDAMRAADDLVLFRTATKQVCRRMGYTATFMCRPGLKGYFSSGWHLHQSLIDAGSGRNLLTPETAEARLSPLGLHYLGGLVHHAVPSAAFTTPTVNGYRRFRPNSLAPDRAGWGYDNRGAMLRVLGAVDDPASRIENRVGEPAANPYLYIASQIIAGLDGIDQGRDPGPQDDEPYAAERAMLPVSLTAALDALDKSQLFRAEIGDIFIDYFLRLKGNEAGRFAQFLDQAGLPGPGDEVTAWEQNEYFDFF
jgi:glutamine synthetase